MSIHQEMIEIELKQISVNPYQPRKTFAEENLEELMQSIRSVGILHPPTVRQINGKFELISGERRIRAAERLGLEKITVILNKQDIDFSAEASLIENIQRVDLNPMEIAKALRRMITEFGYQQEDLAEKVGKKRSTIANYLRLLTLPKEVQDGVSDQLITMGHAKAILSVDKFEKQIALYRQITQNFLSVREAEHLAQTIDTVPKRRIAFSSDCYLDNLQEKIQQKLGTKVTICGNDKKGKITIDYYNLDDLDRILEMIGVSENDS